MEPQSKQPLRKSHFEQHKKPRAVAKHGIVKTYVNGWTPKLLHSGYETLVIVDGFAGAGTFTSSSDAQHEDSIDDWGSPLIILNALYEHSALKTTVDGRVVLVCIEAMKNNFNALEEALTKFQLRKPKELKTAIEVILYHGDFNEIMTGTVLPKYSQYPMFVFADPFGYGTIKMSTFEKILGTHSPRSPKELFINFMDSYIRRFERTPETKQTQDELFGDSDWRDNLEGVTDADEKLEVICDFFIKKLQAAYPGSSQQLNLNYSLKFGIRGKKHDQVYHLIFVSSHESGYNCMKAAMNRFSQSSFYRVFSEWVDNKEIVRNQKVEKDTNANDILHQIYAQFPGMSVTGQEIWEKILADGAHVNFIVLLRIELRPFKVNNERSFYKILYKFPENPDKAIKALLPLTPRKGEKNATIEDMVGQIVEHFRGKSEVTGSEVIAYAKTITKAVKHNWWKWDL